VIRSSMTANNAARVHFRPQGEIGQPFAEDVVGGAKRLRYAASVLLTPAEGQRLLTASQAQRLQATRLFFARATRSTSGTSMAACSAPGRARGRPEARGNTDCLDESRRSGRGCPELRDPQPCGQEVRRCETEGFPSSCSRGRSGAARNDGRPGRAWLWGALWAPSAVTGSEAPLGEAPFAKAPFME
jgi:hypothetical protein